MSAISILRAARPVLRELAPALAGCATVIATLAAVGYGAPTPWAAGWVASVASALIAWHIRGHRDTQRLADLVRVLQAEKKISAKRTEQVDGLVEELQDERLTSAQLARNANETATALQAEQDLTAQIATRAYELDAEVVKLRRDITTLLEKSL